MRTGPSAHLVLCTSSVATPPRHRFEWLVQQRGNLEDAALDAFLPGERHLVTAHAVYRLLEGLCVEVDDLGMTGRPVKLVGMDLVGWIPLRDEVMNDDWEPGARAVFWRRGNEREIAITSSVIDVKAVGIPRERESDVREMRVSPQRPDVSFAPPRLPRPPIFMLTPADERRLGRVVGGR